MQQGDRMQGMGEEEYARKEQDRLEKFALWTLCFLCFTFIIDCIIGMILYYI